MKELENTKGLRDSIAELEAEEVKELEQAGELLEFDPTSPEHAPGLSLIVLMRIYEVQMALLREVNPEFASRLLQLHEEGKISTPMPWIDPESMNS